jgi:hypothetical protein
MYKQHLLENIERELKLLKQLSPLIEEKDLSYRPTEKVRSTYELMQYLSTIGEYMMRHVTKNDIDDAVRLHYKEYRSSLTRENFNERLDKQLEDIKVHFAEITEEDLMTKEVTLPTRETMPLGVAIITAPIKWLAAYRMELFLYLKMNGNSTIGTKEAWIINANQ